MEEDQEGGDTKRLSLLRKVEGRGEREAFVFARSFVVFFFFIFSQLWMKRGKIERKEGMEWNGTKGRVFGGEGRRVATIEFVKWISSWRTGLSDLLSFHGNEKICVSFNLILLPSASIFLNFPEIWCFLVIQSFDEINSWIREKLSQNSSQTRQRTRKRFVTESQSQSRSQEPRIPALKFVAFQGSIGKRRVVLSKIFPRISFETNESRRESKDS